MLQFSFGDGFSRSCCNKELVASWALGTKGPGQQPLSQAPLSSRSCKPEVTFLVSAKMLHVWRLTNGNRICPKISPNNLFSCKYGHFAHSLNTRSAHVLLLGQSHASITQPAAPFLAVPHMGTGLSLPRTLWCHPLEVALLSAKADCSCCSICNISPSDGMAKGCSRGSIQPRSWEEQKKSGCDEEPGKPMGSFAPSPGCG